MNSPFIVRRPLPYETALERRDPTTVELVVVHCTELPDLAMARRYGERVHYPGSRTGHSGHFYVDRDGTIEEWVAVERMAHHVRGHNERSIGIELVNRGRYPDWLDSRSQEMTEAYPDPQIDALVALLADLRQRLPSLRRIAGHEDLDQGEVPASDDHAVQVRRKRDPGPCFPWKRVLDAVALQRVAG